MARVLPENSVVIPLTRSWWAWWDMLRSNGDFLILIVSPITNARNAPITMTDGSPPLPIMSETLNDPV